MSEKANLIDIVSECCVEMLSAEQIQTLQGKLYLKLRDFDVVRCETALSTEFECDNSVYSAISRRKNGKRSFAKDD